jgi:broad specificity phosphatase PhoE
MLIRHGEKQPDSGPPPYGVNADGQQDEHSLSTRGWQRAGALVKFFVEPRADGIEPPEAVYASKVGPTVLIADGHDISKSLRPQQTVMPLVDAIGPKDGLQTPFAVGEEAQLVQAVTELDGDVVLIAWEHHHIPLIAAAFSSDSPGSWPGSRFDLVWVLTRKKRGSYRFDQVCQSLLGGDLRDS